MSNQSCPMPKEGPMTIDELITSLEAEIKLLEDHIRMIEDGKIQDPCPECRKKDLVQRKRQLGCIRAMYSDITDLNGNILGILAKSIIHTADGVHNLGIHAGQPYLHVTLTIDGKESIRIVEDWIERIRK